MSPCASLGSIAAQAAITAHFAADGGLVHAHDGSNLGLVMLGFHQGVNLISLLLGKLRVDSHRCFSFLAERKA